MDISTLHNPVIVRLLESLKSYYNINLFNEEPFLCARCDYFEKSEKFMVSKKANLWTANAEEFLFLFYVPHLTLEIVTQCMALVAESWPKLASIDKNHMYTYVTPVFVCDTADADAVKAVTKCHIYKSFNFSFWGWMEYHTAVVVESDGSKKIFSNRRGTCVKKMLSKVLI